MCNWGIKLLIFTNPKYVLCAHSDGSFECPHHMFWLRYKISEMILYYTLLSAGLKLEV